MLSLEVITSLCLGTCPDATVPWWHLRLPLPFHVMPRAHAYRQFLSRIWHTLPFQLVTRRAHNYRKPDI